VEIAGRPCLVTTTEDITEQRQAEQALSYSHQQLQDVIDGAPAFVTVKDLAGRFITLNRQMEQAFGMTREQLRGKTDYDMVPVEMADSYRRHDAQALNTGHPVQVEEITRTPDGREYTMLASKFPLVDPGGQPYAVCVMSVDITERKKTERQLQTLNETLEQRVAERTVQLRELAVQLTRAEQQERRRIAHILHEHFQQLLVTVKHRLNRIRNRTQDADLLDQLQQAEGILGEAIQASRSLTVELCPPVVYDMGLAAALRWLGRWMWDNHGLTVEVQADDQANPSAEEVSVLLFEAVRELLFNVLKHAQTLHARVEMRPAAGQTRIVVRDEGSGFDPSGQDRSKGFGLFGIRHRLELLGGTFQMESTRGWGTCITLVSPQ
jgi:PAS domain S-box-containing protein